MTFKNGAKSLIMNKGVSKMQTTGEEMLALSAIISIIGLLILI